MRLYRVYFAQKGDLIKIGCSSQPSVRSRQLKAKLLGIMDGAFCMEREIHEEFSGHRHSGEWFNDCEQIRHFIDENCRSWRPDDDDNPAPDQGSLLAVKDLAKLLKIGTAKVYEMAKTGTGPRSVQIGGLIKYRPESVEQWLAEQEAATQRAGESPVQ